jgi:hypothetical protein
MARITVEGRPLEVAEGTTILDALGTTIPQLCSDARVAPVGACGSCLVHVAGLAKAVPACTTLVVDGMEIATHTPELETGRREILDMLAERIPSSGHLDSPTRSQPTESSLAEPPACIVKTRERFMGIGQVLTMPLFLRRMRSIRSR